MIIGTGVPETHEGCRYTPFTLEIYVDHAFFEDTKVLFQSILHRCDNSKLREVFACICRKIVEKNPHWISQREAATDAAWT